MRRISIVFMFALMWVTTISAQKVPVILTAGQSNTDGRVTLDDLPDELREYSYCLWSYGSGDFETASGEFSPYFPRVAKPKIEQSWGFDAVVYSMLSCPSSVEHFQRIAAKGVSR